MVDSINGIKQPIQPAKEVSIDWKGCTAEEIIDYKGQGQDVPVEFLRWAQDMTKIQGAPDDITYEMAFGKTDNAKDIETSNTAAGLKNVLDTQNVSLIDQARIFADSDNKFAGTIQSYIDQIDTLIQNSTDSVSKAETEKNNILEKVQTLISRQNEIKANSGEKNSKGGEIAGLEAQIKALGNLGIETTRQAGAPITQADGAFEEGSAATKTGLDLGNQTYPIAEQLIAQGQGGYSYSPQLTAGINALNAADLVTNSSKAGSAKFVDAKAENTPNANKLNEFTNEIARTANVSAAADVETGGTNREESTGAQNTNQTTPENPEPTGNTKTPPKAEETKNPGDVKDDTKITTDPNEILKRKERKGIV